MARSDLIFTVKDGQNHGLAGASLGGRRLIDLGEKVIFSIATA